MASNTPTTNAASMATDHARVIRRVVVSEKSARGQAHNQYTFEVDRKATKTQVRDAVMRLFKVKVDSVNIVRLPAKHRRVGKYEGASSAMKKAIVTLKKGETIAQAQP
jgi:large subunit ribosomal protein L23